MSHKGMLTGAIGIGLGTAIVGMHAYMCMSPKGQRDMQKNLKKAVDELADIAEDIGDSMKGLR